MGYKIAKVILPIFLDKEFDYYTGGYKLKLFNMVLVDFRGKKQIGIITSFSNDTNVKVLKPILDVIVDKPVLTKEQFLFAKKISEFYSYPIGEFLFMMLPHYIIKKNISFDIKTPKIIRTERKPVKIFIKQDTFLERYKVLREYMDEKIKHGSILICFPQISYLEYAKKIIEKDFNHPIHIFNSREGKLKIFSVWLNSREKSIILGTRMAIFYYPYDLELLIIEEENSPYYFQEERPYYNLLNIAFLLSKIKKVDLILSSNFPSLYTYKLIKENKIILKEGEENKKEIEVVNISYTKDNLSPLFLNLIKKNILEGEKIALIFNRKGYAKIAKCLSCGYVLTCDNCSSFLQIYFDQDIAICPYCNRKIDIPKICPKCNIGYIKGLGFGIEKFKSILRRIFNEFKIDSLENKTADTDIILSTSKILDRLEEQDNFVGFIYDIDWFFSREDYDASFYTFIYIRRLSSFFKKTYVFTSNIEHYIFKDILNWKNFYEKELSLRKEFKLPPYYSICRIVIRGKNNNKVFLKAKNLYNKLNGRVDIYGPFKETPFKLRKKFRYFLIIKAKNPYILNRLIKEEIFTIRSSTYKVAVIIK